MVGRCINRIGDFLGGPGNIIGLLVLSSGISLTKMNLLSIDRGVTVFKELNK